MIAIEEEFLPALDLATGKPVPIDAEPDVARLSDHHEIDLAPLVRDELVMAEPIAPLHSPDCAGLCVECGLPARRGHPRPPDRRHRSAPRGAPELQAGRQRPLTVTRLQHA